MRRAIDTALEWAIVILLAVMLMSVLWGVGTRYLMDDPSSWTDEVARFTLIWLGITGSTYVSGKNAHIAIELLPEYLKPKNQHRLEILIAIIVSVFVICIFIAGGLRYVYISFYLGQTSAALGLPMGYVYLILPVCGFLIVYYKILQILEANKKIKED